MKKIDTVIFDLDGTLLDTSQDFSECINYVLKKYSLPTRSCEEILSFTGNGARKFVERAVPENCPITDEVYKAYREHYSKTVLVHTHPYDQIIELLDELKKQGFKLAIVSNKPDNQVKDLNKIFFSEYIHFAIGDIPGVDMKPKDGSLQLAWKALDSSSETTIYIGDSEVDYFTAKNVGMRHIGVTWGFRTIKQLSDAGVTTFADNPMDILDIIKSYNEQ